MPADLTSVCKEIYNNSSERIRSTEGLTDEIKFRQSIKQGYPFSPLLLNLVLEGILPHVERIDGGYEFGNETKVKIL